MLKKNNLISWQDLDGGCRIAVVGDLILDEYLSGSVQRISPEAPVPVHLVRNRDLTAGGAANVARNIQNAGGSALLLGLAGQDEDGHLLKGILEKDGISTDGIVQDENRVTIKKTRVTANRQQLLRIDWESVHSIGAVYQNLFLAKLEQEDLNGILISDYGKGCLSDDFLSNIIMVAKSRQIKTLVDPKGKNYQKYCGAYLVTPNWKEACEALNLDPLDDHNPAEVAVEIRDRFSIDNVIITLGERGMVGASGGDLAEDVFHLPAETREVFDVSGAGDTVVAILALAIGSGAPIRDAMLIANVAAGLVVEKWGTQPISLRELYDALERIDCEGDVSSSRKVVRDDVCRNSIGNRGERSKKVVFTNGCFDLLHSGHVSYLEKARAKGDLLVVGLNSDESVKLLKGPSRPLIPMEQRASVLAGLACVDLVVIFDEVTPRRLIDFLQPDVLIKGADYSVEEIVGAESVIKGGGVVETVELVDGVSTTTIIEKAIKARDAEFS